MRGFVAPLALALTASLGLSSCLTSGEDSQNTVQSSVVETPITTVTASTTVAKDKDPATEARKACQEFYTHPDEYQMLDRCYGRANAGDFRQPSEDLDGQSLTSTTVDARSWLAAEARDACWAAYPNESELSQLVRCHERANSGDFRPPSEDLDGQSLADPTDEERVFHWIYSDGEDYRCSDEEPYACEPCDTDYHCGVDTSPVDGQGLYCREESSWDGGFFCWTDDIERDFLNHDYYMDERSEDVRVLQLLLDVTADSHYGNQTRNAHIAALQENGMSISHVPPAVSITTPPPTTAPEEKTRRVCTSRMSLSYDPSGQSSGLVPTSWNWCAVDVGSDGTVDYFEYNYPVEATCPEEVDTGSTDPFANCW